MDKRAEDIGEILNRSDFGNVLKSRYGTEMINGELILDNRKEEKINGKIYYMATPCDEHKDVQFNMASELNIYFRQNKKRCVARIEAEVRLENDDYVLPDIGVYCYNNSMNVPIIIIEVLSKSTRKRDLTEKMELYASLGIKEYWIITWEISAIDVYVLNDSGGYNLHDTYVYNGETEQEFSPVSVPELKIKLEDVFYFVT